MKKEENVYESSQTNNTYVKKTIIHCKFREPKPLKKNDVLQKIIIIIISSRIFLTKYD